jgi:hypothetical protein
MQVHFQSRASQALDMRAGVERRVRFALRRLAPRVPRAEVVFEDVNGPRGGRDKLCRLALTTDGNGPLIVYAVAADWRTALDTALARIHRTLARAWERAESLRRGRTRRPPPGDEPTRR